MKNYYEEKIFVIESLIKEKKYKEANEQILIELNVPYVPMIYESIFQNMLEQIKENLDTKKTNKKISIDIAMDYLLSNDYERESIALELLKEHNLHLVKEIIKNRIETWNHSKIILKSYLFEMLIEQNIDININFGPNIHLNPIKSQSILNHKEVKETEKEIEKLLLKNPSWFEMAMDQFHKLLLLTYPSVPTDSKNLANDIYEIIKSYFDNNITLSNKQQKIKSLLSM